MSAKGRTRCGQPLRPAPNPFTLLSEHRHPACTARGHPVRSSCFTECNSTPRAGSKPKCWMATDNESRKRRRGPSDVRCDPCNPECVPQQEASLAAVVRRLLPTHSHRRSEISVVGQLLEHEISDIGAPDAVRPKKVAQVRP